MRTHFVVASVAFAAALTACNRQDVPPTKPATSTERSQSGLDLASAPRPYERMRFVSELEQLPGVARTTAAERGRHAARIASRHHDAIGTTRAALASLAAIAPVATAVVSGPSNSPSVAVSSTHAAPPMSMPAEVAGEFADRGHSDHGFEGHVMIRGGVGPDGKCDPRSDAQAAGLLAGRPNSAMPLMPSASVFGRR